MTSLNRKLFRDIFHLRGQLIAAALVVMCGAASFVTMRTAYDSLLTTRASYYTSYRFADIWASLKRAPESVAERIRRIPGVSSVQTRIAVGVSLDVPGLEEPATGLMISVPELRAPMLNDIYIRKGRYIEPGRRDEVMVSEAFATANTLDVGDRVGAVVNGGWEEFTIVGIALSPEFVYELGSAAVLPDNRRFGVFWTARQTLAGAFAMEGTFNDLVLTTSHGANQRRIIDEIDHILAPYGSLGAYGREGQTSDVFLTSELAQLRTTGTAVPVIFLGVAAFLLHIVLSRLVRTQRDQIAVLKAFGYTDRAVGAHYLGMALAAVVTGGVLGILFGTWAGSAITEVYAQFYRFPMIRYAAGPASLGMALLISGGSALVGALSAVRGAIALPPAEAMRPEAPERFTAGFLERIGLQRFLPTSSRMIVRSLERNPGKSLLSILGIALSVAILIVGRYSGDAIDVLTQLQFEGAQREDATVVFAEPLPTRVLYDIAALPGVLTVEPFRSLPATLVHGHREKKSAITMMREGSRLRRIIDMQGEVRQPPTHGVMLTRQLGEALGADAGDTIRVELMEGSRPVREIVVDRLIDEFVGLNAYVGMAQGARLVEGAERVSGAWVTIDAAREEEFNRALKRVPAVAGTQFRRAALASFNKTIAESQGISRSVMIFFACVIAIGVLYNSARISLSERGRELASLRVLGFRKGEVTFYLLGEQAILTLIALPIGFGIGWLMLLGLVEGFASDLFRFPLVISPTTLAFATLVTLAAATLSGLLVRRRIFHLDLIEVLKTRE